MDKDGVIGAGKQVIGSVKEVVGKLVGDAKLQVEGKLQNAAGSAKDELRG
jgi:uncharacterized protein YjbJ (UPF0337 family)